MEVLALINEVSDVRVVLNEQKTALIDSPIHKERSKDAKNALRGVLERIGCKVIQIEKLVQKSLNRSGKTSFSKSRRFAWVRKKAEVSILHQELQTLKTAAMEHFALINL